MNVWLIDEGTPGHTVQTAGLWELLKSKSGFHAEWIPCELRLRGWMRPVARWFVGRTKGRTAMMMARMLYPSLKLPANRDVELIISSCGKSAYLNRLLCKALGARGVFIGEIKPFPAEWFGLIVTPVQQGFANELLVPVIETGRTYESGLAAMQAQWRDEAPTGCWTLLIGGSSRTHPFGSEDWDALAAGIISLARRHSIRWLISTSRRTGLEAENHLRKILPPDVIAEVVWYGSAPKKVVGGYLAAGERIFVTQDSLTMMSEGLAMGKRVELLRPRKWDMPEASFNGRYLSRLVASELVGATDIEHFANHVPPSKGMVSIDSLRGEFAKNFLNWVENDRGNI